MTVLVTAASQHGATAEIAARIAGALVDDGFEVDVKRPDEVNDLGPYEAFVVGSAVYLGHWLKPATTFVEAHGDELARRPTWLFSSGPIVGNPPRPVPDDARQGDELAGEINAREHKVFPGKLDRSQLNWCERVAVRCAHASEGDHRDWNEIEAWAAAIGGELRQARTPAAVS
jgi:menaquinone-dependent protoporphyrinogen oxidase